jgi:hypothetical protein
MDMVTSYIDRQPTHEAGAPTQAPGPAGRWSCGGGRHRKDQRANEMVSAGWPAIPVHLVVFYGNGGSPTGR